MREIGVHWESVVNFGRVWEGVSMHVDVLEKVLNNVNRSNWYPELGYTGEGMCLMQYIAFIGWGGMWKCICIVYYL